MQENQGHGKSNFAMSLIDFYEAYIYNCTGNIEFSKKYENCEEIC